MANDTVSRFREFIGKVQERVIEILSEADAGFDQIIAINVTDPASMAGALTAFESRMKQLSLKVSDATSKMSLTISGAILDTLIEEGELLVHHIEIKTHEMLVGKRVKAARALWSIVETDTEQPHRCINCNGLLEIVVKHAASSPRCSFCGAINQVQPSAAVTAYYYGDAVAALSEEAALKEWREMMDETRRYHNIRIPTDRDKRQHRDTAERYWTAYCAAYANLHPDWTMEQVQREVHGKMSSWNDE